MTGLRQDADLIELRITQVEALAMLAVCEDEDRAGKGEEIEALVKTPWTLAW